MCEPMKVLVSGGVGFVCSHVVGRLVNEGHEVRVIDKLSTGKLENIADYFGVAIVYFINSDIRDTLANISKAKKLWGYTPKFSLKNGLVPYSAK